jgi:outer membrane protein OmpA-like peptidoglycan-associated protein
MKLSNFLTNIYLLLTLTTLLASCQLTPPFKPLPNDYLEFDSAIHQLSSHLLTQLQNRQDLLGKLLTPSQTLVFNPFIEIDNGQVVQVSLEIENRFFEEVHQHFQNFQIARITWENLPKADYVINGFLKYEADPNYPHVAKYYHITASIIDLKTKQVAANAQVNIVSPRGLNYQPTPSYQDNPMFVKDLPLQNLIRIIESPVGTKIDENFYHFIKTKSLIVEGQTAYNQGHYEQARRLFQEARKQPDGNIIEVYGGLYTANYKLNNITAAEDNFSKMVAVGVENGSLPIKFLFEPNLTDFLNNQELRGQYVLWLKQIGLYFQTHPGKCVEIIGHTSKYGLYKMNKSLSERRAYTIQAQVQQIFPGIVERSKVLGKGNEETIVGTAPDSAENAIDRRVEFKIIDCFK